MSISPSMGQILNFVRSGCRSRDERALPNICVPALLVLHLAAAYTPQVFLEVRNRGLLDVLKSKAINGLNSSAPEPFARAASNPRHKDSLAVIDRADHSLQAVLLGIAALAVVVHPAMPDKLAARGADHV